MKSMQFDPALSQVLASHARTKLLTVLVERRREWFTATELCDLADVSESGFHRDHKSVLIEFGLVERQDDSQSRLRAR